MKNNHMFLRISIFALFLTAFQLQAAENPSEFFKSFEKNKLEIALCARDCPQEVLEIIYKHLLGAQIGLINQGGEEDKSYFLGWLHSRASSGDVDTIRAFFVYNQIFKQGNRLLNPYTTNDSVEICRFYDFVNDKKNNVPHVDEINKIVSTRYPFAPWDAWYRYQGFTWSTWDYGKIVNFLTAGFIIPIYPNRTPQEPMLHYLLGAVYNSNQTQNSVYIKPNYPLLKSFFENGANPNYTLEVRKYKWANNYTSTFINAFDVIQNSDHPDEEKEKLTLLAQECVRSPINTKDPFYPDSRGYRADFAEYLKPD